LTTFTNCVTGSRKILPTEDGLPPLGNALVWAWDTATNKVVNTDLVDHKTIFS
jgi:leucyl-tRNA synthetase